MFFSHSIPNLIKVIPTMDHIDEHLMTSALNSKYHPAIQATLAVGKKLLNKYYTITDQLEVYCIAMSKYPMLFYLDLSDFITDKFYIQVISLNIFKTWVGRMNGSQWWWRSWRLSLNRHMQASVSQIKMWTSWYVF